MSRSFKFGNWNQEPEWKESKLIWQPKETLAPVTTRSSLTTGNPFLFGSDSDKDWNSSGREDPKSSSETEIAEVEEGTVGDMANAVDDDPEIGSLTAHLDGDPAQSIVTTQRQKAIDIMTNVLSIQPNFSGKMNGCP